MTRQNFIFYCAIAVVAGVCLSSCSNDLPRFKANSFNYAVPMTTNTWYSYRENISYFSPDENKGHIVDHSITYGGQDLQYNGKLLFVSDRALADVAQAIEKIDTLSADTKRAIRGVNGKLDYYKLLSSQRRRSYGKQYWDFLCQRVRDYCLANGIAVGKKSELPPIEGIQKLRSTLNDRRMQTAKEFYSELTDTGFDFKLFRNKYKRICSSRMVEEMKKQKLNYWNDKHLSYWRLFWAATPSTAKGHHFSLKQKGSDWVEVTPTDSLGRASGDVPPVLVEIMFYGKKLVPVIVGVNNAAYTVDLHLDI